MSVVGRSVCAGSLCVAVSHPQVQLAEDPAAPLCILLEKSHTQVDSSSADLCQAQRQRDISDQSVLLSKTACFCLACCLNVFRRN